MDTPARLADDLDTGAVYWRNLTKRQRRAAIMHALTRLAIEDDYLTTRRWDAARPRWAPLANNLQSSIGASLSDLAARVGMHMRTSRKLCDCGSQWTHTVDIQIVNSSGATLPETLRLCDACYAEFVAMEAAYA